MTQIVVVDDDQAVADSTAALLRSHGFQVSTFYSAEEILTNLSELPECCLLLDLKMPGLSGLDLQKRLQKMGRSIPVIFLTGHGDVAAAVTAMKLGAVDFLEKPVAEEALLNALDSGVRSLSGEKHERPAKGELEARLSKLTDREREVLKHLVRGKINKVIAHDLGISQRTVEIHRSRIKMKMNARSLADLIEMMSDISER